ncbi:MFS transporter [Companilactobacillus keshanensis]|uniref:MFS transporter n=1 Tax=Companilactobacillus keshanensis TaxID=2486003 RepID=A0ABW4BT27_9LACO|nr:MFS transporter [Companilactobacillus keshanensis]
MDKEYQGTNKLLLGIVLSVLTYWLFAQSLLNMAPDVQVDLQISSGILNTGISITSLFSGIFIVVAGGLADRLGRVRTTYLGIVLNIIGSLALIIANGSVLFILGRILQGISAACIMPATIALIKEYYHDDIRQRALSYWSIGSWGGSGLCSFFGGFVDSNFGWKYVFVISIIFSIVSGILIWKTPESKIESGDLRPFDWLGMFVFIVFVLNLNILISNGLLFKFSLMGSILIIVLLISGLAFFKLEKKIVNKFVDFKLFTNRSYLTAVISNFLLNAMIGTLLVVNSYVQQSRGLSAVKTGSLSISYLVLVLLMIRVGEKLLQKVGPKKPMILGAIISTLGALLMSLTMIESNYFMLVVIGYGLFGLGFGLYATPSTDTAVSNAPDSEAGEAAGIYKMASALGGAIGTSISASIYSAFKDYNLGALLGLWTNAAFGILALICIGFLLPNNKK